MSLFKKYLEIIQEAVYTEKEFRAERMSQKEKGDMDYITFSMTGESSKMYVCDKDGKFCDPETTKISNVKKMIEDELKAELTYSEQFINMKNYDKATVKAAVEKSVNPFNEGFLTIVSQKKK